MSFPCSTVAALEVSGVSGLGLSGKELDWSMTLEEGIEDVVGWGAWFSMVARGVGSPGSELGVNDTGAPLLGLICDRGARWTRISCVWEPNASVGWIGPPWAWLSVTCGRMEEKGTGSDDVPVSKDGANCTPNLGGCLFTGGYGSPRACASWFRRCISALLGLPRFRGGSLNRLLSTLGDNCWGVRMSMLGYRPGGMGFGWIARCPAGGFSTWKGGGRFLSPGDICNGAVGPESLCRWEMFPYSWDIWSYAFWHAITERPTLSRHSQFWCWTFSQ